MIWSIIVGQLNNHWTVKPLFLGSSHKPNLTHWGWDKISRHFAGNIFTCIFLNENVWTYIKFVPKGPIDNVPALVQIMARCRQGNRPLSEPTMLSLLTHMYVTRSQSINLFVNSLRQSNAYMRWQSKHHRFRKWLVAWSVPNHYLN